MNMFKNMEKSSFVDRFGSVYEHSPWIAETLFDRGISDAMANSVGLSSALAEIVDAADHEKKLALLKAHPDLAGKLAISGDLTEASRSEQSGAGLDECTPEEFEEFQILNQAYKDKFGFPFILAVHGWHRRDILKAFRERIDNPPEIEFAKAVSQVHRIARLRLDNVFRNAELA